MYTSKPLGNGKVEIFENGKAISNGTGFDPAYAATLVANSGAPTTELPDTNAPAEMQPSLPDADQAPATGLVGFANKLDAVVNIAKKKRNELSLDIMAPYRGTVAASDFNGILGNLNRASDTFTQDALKRTLEEDKVTYETISDATGGVYEVQKDSSGKIIGSPTKIFEGKAPAAGGGLDGPTSYQEWVLAGQPGTYAEYLKESNIKAPTVAQQTVATYASRIEQSDPVIASLQDTLTSMNPAMWEAQRRLPSYLQTAQYRQFDQASRNFINAVLRRESGAVISDAEFENAYRQYLPRPNDDEQTLLQKQQNRKIVGASFVNAAGSAYQSVDQLLAQEGTASGTADYQAYLDAINK